jgi:AraC family transcriptional regulator
VHSHLAENITLDALAGCAGLSRYHFARRFRASTGMTPHQYVLQERVAKARTLITRTNVRLAEVATTCGFADQSHLNRVFKRFTGVSPGIYRQQG